MRTHSPAPEPAAPDPAAREILARLAADAVARLGLRAAAVVLDQDDAPPHAAGELADQRALLDALHRHPPDHPHPTTEAGASLRTVPLAHPGGAPFGHLCALHGSTWTAAEAVAVESLAAAALAELRCHAERDACRRVEERLRLLERALHGLDVGVTITDPAGTIVFTNPAEAKMHGYQVEELQGRAARTLAPPELWSAGAGLPERPVRRWMRERVNVRRDGSRFPVRLWSDVVAADDDRPLGLVTWSEDLSRRTGTDAAPVPAERDRDALTGLLDRVAFLRALGEACAARREPGGGEFAVLFVDLDRFKAVNDRLGHAAGDAFLGVVGERLAASVRPTDLVGRVGGDEFAALLHGVEREAEALSAVHRIQRLLAEPVVVAGVEMTASASIGVALGASAETPEGLLGAADRAMYRAKNLGAGQHGFSEPGEMAHEAAVLEVERELRRGIAAGELTLRYQPIVAIGDGQLMGMEALVRWRHPARGLLGPQAFLPVAETTGAIVEVDGWVLREAARQLRAWSDHPVLGQVPLSINFSGRHVVHPRVVQEVEQALRRFGVPPARLVMEVTESSLVEDFQTAASVLAALRELGVGICLDDFGTGYSSLGYLRQLGFDRLKIDRSFVQRIADSQPDQAIVRGVVALAEALSLTLTAEGVETPAQRAVLQRLGCREGQGFLFGRPMEAEALPAWLGVAGG